MSGIFITFEGIEGCGKSTQIRLLNDRLNAMGFSVVLTREPGGTKIGEKVRDILLSPESKAMSAVAELLLYAAARNQHIAEKIAPSLKAGKIVLCDRYADATTAYQGAARRIDMRDIETIHGVATGGLMPNATMLLDCEPKVGLARALARNAAENANGVSDRFEREALDFHERVRSGYLAIAKKNPERVHVIDANRSEEEISLDIANIASALLKKFGKTGANS